MITEYIKSLLLTKEIVLAVLFSISELLVIHYYLFKDHSLKVVMKYWLGTAVTLIITMKILLICYFTVFFFSYSNITHYIIISILFSLVYFLILSLKTSLGLKYALPKAKKLGGLKEMLDSLYTDNLARTVNLLTISALLLLAMFLLGNGAITSLLVLLAISVLVSSISVLYLLPVMLKISDKLVNLFN